MEQYMIRASRRFHDYGVGGFSTHLHHPVKQKLHSAQLNATAFLVPAQGQYNYFCK